MVHTLGTWGIHKKITYMLSAQTSPKRTFKKLCAVAHTCNLSTQAVGIGKSLGMAGPKQ